jgi:hypothetical protein
MTWRTTRQMTAINNVDVTYCRTVPPTTISRVQTNVDEESLMAVSSPIIEFNPILFEY